MNEAKTILVVEDDAIIAWDIQQTLQRLGYAVPALAQTCDEALDACEAARPDLVLMDIKLKGAVDGIEAAERLHARWDLPVVYLTSHSDEATLSRAKSTGPHGYLLKPFHERDLRTTIEVALHKHAMESQLVARERWFATTLRSIGDAVIATDRHQKITFLNPVAEALTGWSSEDALGRALSEVLHLVDEDGRRVEGPLRGVLEELLRVELPPDALLRARAGEVRAIGDSAAPIVDARGELLGGVVVFRDITERKRLEERLARSERLATLGAMAAAMGHEINNPLAAAIASAWMIGETLKRAEAAAEGAPGADAIRRELGAARGALKNLDEAAGRIRQIVQDMRRALRVESAAQQLLDLPNVLDAALRMTEHQVRDRVTVRRLYGTTPYVVANETQLVQVFTNLVVNAAQSFDEGRDARCVIELVTRTDEAGHGVVEVRDNGRGIPRKDLRRVFDPFFTTRASGGGMGLGLAICHEIVSGLGGTLEVESEVGVGTTFRVALPPAATPPEGAAP